MCRCFCEPPHAPAHAPPLSPPPSSSISQIPRSGSAGHFLFLEADAELDLGTEDSREALSQMTADDVRPTPGRGGDKQFICASVTGTRTHEPKARAGLRSAFRGPNEVYLHALCFGRQHGCQALVSRSARHALEMACTRVCSLPVITPPPPLYHWPRPARPSLQSSSSTPSLRSHRSSLSRALVSYQLPPFPALVSMLATLTPRYESGCAHTTVV